MRRNDGLIRGSVIKRQWLMGFARSAPTRT
jgi:hypothetical protein